jgi:hypothetical protein
MRFLSLIGPSAEAAGALRRRSLLALAFVFALYASASSRSVSLKYIHSGLFGSSELSESEPEFTDLIDVVNDLVGDGE